MQVLPALYTFIFLKSMKIVHIHWSLGTGGVETMLPDIANAQTEANEVAFVVINDWVEPSILAKFNQDKVRMVFLGRRAGSKNPWPIIKLNLFLVKFKPDIIHTHAYQVINLVIYPWGRRVRTIHNTYNICSEYPKFDKLIAISRTVQDFTSNQGFDSVLADNGIPVKRICHTRKNVFSDGKLHFVQVSRLYVRQKGQDLLLEALSLLKNNGSFHNFVMHFVGDGADEAMLRRKCHDLQLDENVVFEGLKEQSWIYGNLCNFDLFIQPSRYEGFGLTVAEAIAAKVPVLVSNIDGPLEIIDGGRLGMAFENENASDCASQIKRFVERGRDERQVEEAYRYVCDHYDVAVTARKYLEVYQSLLK